MSIARELIKRALTGTGLGGSANGRHKQLDTLGAPEAYRLWAPTYAAETAASYLDEALASEMLHGLPRTRLLDAGCGVGRRIAHVPGAIGMDASPEMLAAGGLRNVVVGDVRAMPFASCQFEMVWCRLVLGHIPDPLRAYQELSRVCMPGGYVFVTDFHPDAAAAGHRRTFTDSEGAVHEIEHYPNHDHLQLAESVGFSVVSHRDGVVGPSIRSFYSNGIGLSAYKRDLSLKLVTALLFHRAV
jgi:malonyl-CoA O-methyltransferase